MRVMVDTNVLISAMVFRSAKMHELLTRIHEKHVLCISSYALDETKRILSERFECAKTNIEVFLQTYPYICIDIPVKDEKHLARIRDESDYPHIHAAILGHIDVFVTGDKDFFGIKIDRPEIVTPREFMEKY